LDDATFAQRITHLIAAAVPAGLARQPGEPVHITFDKLAPVQLGAVRVDLADQDLFGYPGQVPFRVRRERGAWLSYFSDADRHKDLLLPVGNYYLMVDKRVRNVFTIRAQQTVPVAAR
ncbi:MAG TPA: hypothetical protein VL359_09745, partial [bacterium]|nr:hypothetical protein [bacterium]